MPQILPPPYARHGGHIPPCELLPSYLNEAAVDTQRSRELKEAAEAEERRLNREVDLAFNQMKLAEGEAAMAANAYHAVDQHVVPSSALYTPRETPLAASLKTAWDKALKRWDDLRWNWRNLSAAWQQSVKDAQVAQEHYNRALDWQMQLEGAFAKCPPRPVERLVDGSPDPGPAEGPVPPKKTKSITWAGAVLLGVTTVIGIGFHFTGGNGAATNSAKPVVNTSGKTATGNGVGSVDDCLVGRWILRDVPPSDTFGTGGGMAGVEMTIDNSGHVIVDYDHSAVERVDGFSQNVLRGRTSVRVTANGGNITYRVDQPGMKVTAKFPNGRSSVDPRAMIGPVLPQNHTYLCDDGELMFSSNQYDFTFRRP
jgi:hypothetical protein